MQMAGGFDGAVWGLNASLQIHPYDPSNPADHWGLIPGTLGQLVVAGGCSGMGSQCASWLSGSGQAYQFRWP